MRKIIYLYTTLISLCFVSGCSIFTLDHTNPNDPSFNSDGGELFPSYTELKIDNKVRGDLSALGTYKKTYFFKFLPGETYTLSFDRLGYESTFYGYFSLYVLDQDEYQIYHYDELYMDRDFTINTYLFSGDYIILKFELDDLKMMDYTIELLLD